MPFLLPSASTSLKFLVLIRSLLVVRKASSNRPKQRWEFISWYVTQEPTRSVAAAWPGLGATLQTGPVHKETPVFPRPHSSPRGTESTGLPVTAARVPGLAECF